MRPHVCTEQRFGRPGNGVVTQSFTQAMACFCPALPLVVGLSGGADSTALLLACAERWPGQVRAIHVHHGLQSAADDFERHCVGLCARLQVPLVVQRVDGRPAPGQSPEDAARIARYKAFEGVALTSQAIPAIQSIALAQHADDQVETLLLALSRGAGVAGLAAMPACWQRLAWPGTAPCCVWPGPNCGPGCGTRRVVGGRPQQPGRALHPQPHSRAPAAGAGSRFSGLSRHLCSQRGPRSAGE